MKARDKQNNQREMSTGSAKINREVELSSKQLQS